MKLAIARTLLSLLLLSPAALLAQTQKSNAYLTAATDYFTDAQGNVGIYFVDRFLDSTTGITTTELTYSFCLTYPATPCLRGSGVIPDAAFTGNLTTKKPDVLRLQVDTNIPGFRNELCLVSDPAADGGCDSVAPATGGVLSLTFSKTTAFSQSSIGTFVEKHFGVVTINTTAGQYQFSGNVSGTVMGANANDANNGAALELLTFTSGKVGHAAALKLADRLLEPKVSLQLQQIRGSK